MNKKYLCPKHQEDTPSANAYADGYHCFGCGARGPLSELGLKDGERIEYTYIEDVAASIERIDRLPRQEIRGFSLPADDRGYYLVWLDKSYYKRRVYGADASSKYRGPAGVKKTAFVSYAKASSRRVILVEGEFNAMSLALVEPDATIVSPGGAGDFYSAQGKKAIPTYVRWFDKVDVVVDSDAAGAQAAIETKAMLISQGCPEVRIHLVDKDFNDILTQDGKEALREEAKRMGLY